MESQELQLSPATDIIAAKRAAFESQEIGASILGKLDAQTEYLDEVRCIFHHSLSSPSHYFSPSPRPVVSALPVSLLIADKAVLNGCCWVSGADAPKGGERVYDKSMHRAFCRRSKGATLSIKTIRRRYTSYVSTGQAKSGAIGRTRPPLR
jgi:hypothetical protein